MNELISLRCRQKLIEAQNLTFHVAFIDFLKTWISTRRVAYRGKLEESASHNVFVFAFALLSRNVVEFSALEPLRIQIFIKILAWQGQAKPLQHILEQGILIVASLFEELPVKLSMHR